MTENTQRGLWILRVLSALFLVATGGIHLYLVFAGTGGVLGVAFTLNAVGGLVLGIGMIVLHGRRLMLATVLSLLFLVATLGALVLALTISLFGITQTWDALLVPQTVVIESIGTNPVQVVVERAMYSDAAGVFWAAGSNAVATKLQ